jgi:hypothetical protein
MRTKLDEAVARPARHDPRREDSEPPPSRADEEPQAAPAPPPAPAAASPAAPPAAPPADDAARHASAEAIDVSTLVVPSEPPPAPPKPAPEPAPIVAAADDAPPLPVGRPSRAEESLRAPVAGYSVAITSVDPRLESIEPAIAKGDWAEVSKALGSDEQAGRLPPNLGLIFALARKESEPEDAPGHKGSTYNELAIRCMAGLFGVPEQSPIALVLAKRLLRKNPVSWQKRPAPPAKISFLLIVLAIAVCGGLTWAITQGYIQFRRVG